MTIGNAVNIEETASRLLNESYAFDASTSLTRVASYLNLQIVNASFHDDSISGMLIYNNEEKTIYINSAQPIVRQRFTIAHEIGHLVLHSDLVTKNGGSVFYRSQINCTDAQEIEANRFAAALLMPDAEFCEYFKKVNSTVLVAARFKVSNEAASRRMSALGLR